MFYNAIHQLSQPLQDATAESTDSCPELQSVQDFATYVKTLTSSRLLQFLTSANGIIFQKWVRSPEELRQLLCSLDSVRCTLFCETTQSLRWMLCGA